MKDMARMLVKNVEIRIVCNRIPRKEENGDWSLGGTIVPGEAVTVCVGYALWLKPNSKVLLDLVTSPTGQDLMRVTYPDTHDRIKVFFIRVDDFSSIYEATISRFENQLI